MPTCAPDSWVESERSACWSPRAPLSPAAAACATLLRSTVTNENSAATNTPQAAIRSSAASSSSQAVIGALLRDQPAGRAGDFGSRPWAGGRVLTVWGRSSRHSTGSNIARRRPAGPTLSPTPRHRERLGSLHDDVHAGALPRAEAAAGRRPAPRRPVLVAPPPDPRAPGRRRRRGAAVVRRPAGPRRCRRRPGRRAPLVVAVALAQRHGHLAPPARRCRGRLGGHGGLPALG